MNNEIIYIIKNTFFVLKYLKPKLKLAEITVIH